MSEGFFFDSSVDYLTFYTYESGRDFMLKNSLDGFVGFDYKLGKYVIICNQTKQRMTTKSVS